MDDSLVIVGASVRAAAQSARRAGLRPWCADLFADRDLQACADARRVNRYPDDLFAALQGAPPGAWMYTGGLENFSDEIDRFAESRELLGCRGAGLRSVRDPFVLHRTLTDAGFHAPQCRRFDDPPSTGEWLDKPNRGSGGRGIRRFAIGDASRKRRSKFGTRRSFPRSGVGMPLRDAPASPPDSTETAGRGAKRSFAALRSQAELGNEKNHFQQFLAGRSISAVGVGDGSHGSLLGVTRQLVGGPGAPEFAYCGSVGPITLASAAHATVVRLIDHLAGAFDLRGLFGVDLILDDADRPWVIEVNPRWPASVEVLELAIGLPAMRIHVDACRGKLLVESVREGEAPAELGAGFDHPADSGEPCRPVTRLGGSLALPNALPSRQAVAKVIHYAVTDGRFPNSDSYFILHPSYFVRDVPHHGEPIRAGMPVITELFAVDDPWSASVVEESRRRFDALLRSAAAPS